jgi:tetratricopeptide (TPR) repeat protein
MCLAKKPMEKVQQGIVNFSPRLLLSFLMIAGLSPAKSIADYVTVLGGFSSTSPGDSPIGKLITEANAKVRTGDTDGARDSLKPLEVDGQSVHPEIVLAELLYAVNRIQEAKETLESLAVSEPQRPDVYLAFSELAIREKRWFDGWNLVNLASRLKAPVHWNDAFKFRIANRIELLRGQCAEGRKDYSQAFSIYEALYSRQSEQKEANAGLVRVTFALGKTEQTLKHLSELKKTDPDLDPPEVMLARLYESQGDFKKAGELYHDALKIATPADLSKAKLAMSRWLLFTNSPNEAASYLVTPFIDAQKDNDERLFLLALVARMQGRYDDARGALNELHSRKPADFAVNNHLALVLIESGNGELEGRALQLALDNLGRSKQSSEAWATVAWIQFRTKKLSEAHTSISKALEAGPPTRDTLHYAIAIANAFGDLKSVAVFSQALLSASGPDFFAHRHPER